MEETEHDIGRFERLKLYVDEHYLNGKLSLEDKLEKVPRGVNECHQYTAGPLRIYVSQSEGTGYHRICFQTITPAVRLVFHATVLGELHLSLGSPFTLQTSTRLSTTPKTSRYSLLDTIFCWSIAFHVALA